MAFKEDSNHSFAHRLRQAWKVAHANAPLLRSTSTSHTMRLKLLQSLVKPCLLYGVETWKLTPDLIAKIIAAERALTRWCPRMSIRIGGSVDESLAAWIQWKIDSAREIARLMEKTKVTRWHLSALRLHWQWAGHAARKLGTMNHEAATAFTAPSKRGHPAPQWSQMLRSFSIKELCGNAEYWIDLAQDRSAWNEFGTYFTQYVETHVLREDTWATLARDVVALEQARSPATST